MVINSVSKAEFNRWKIVLFLHKFQKHSEIFCKHFTQKKYFPQTRLATNMRRQVDKKPNVNVNTKINENHKSAVSVNRKYAVETPIKSPEREQVGV